MKNATFVGWYDNPNFKGEIVTSIPADREDRDMTFYARYQLIYFNYNFESNVAPTPSGGKVEVSGGVMNWINESGNSNFNFKVEGGYQDASQTISFDIYLPEDGSTVMNFQVRLRPEVRNQFDLIVLTVEDGKFYLGKATGTPILDNAVDHGWHRFTLVLENDNAGLAAGQAVEKGTYTTADKFKSNLAVKAYVNGIYRGETMMRTYLTFGEGYYYTHNGKDPVTNNKKDLTFSSQMTIVQIFSSFTPEEVDCNTTVRFDNFHLADGILTVGGKYFLVYKHGAPENEAYLGNREVIALPNLVGDGVSFEGWYTTPDFKAGTEVTDPETMPAGTVFYAKTTSLYKNLIYELSGGEIEGEYPTKFLPNSGEMTLPTNVTAKNGIFLGWYDNPNFEGEPITAISTETDADITVWARFRMECAATLVATPGVRPIKNTDGTVDYLIGISSNAVAVSGSTSNGGMQGQIKGDAITQVVGKSATHFGLSFRVEKESEAFPHFQIRFRCSDKKQHTPLINFNIDGSIGVFGNVIGSYDVTVKWASATGTADGKISIAAFVDDVYIGTYEKTVKIAKPSSYLQVIGQVTDNAHINATNGTLLTDGIPNGSETSEEQTTLYSTDAEGHYGIVRFKNVRIYWGAMRDKE